MIAHNRPLTPGRVFLLLSVVLSALVFPLAAVVRAQDLDREIAGVVGKARLGGASVGVCLIDSATGREIGSYHPDDRLIPASNLKLLTTGTAVAVLGPDFEFRTRLERHGDRLVVVGAGDPAFADPVLLEQMQTTLEAFVDRMVQSVAKSGMTRCDEVIVDDRVFDRDYIHPGWPRDQLDKGYCAEVSGLNFHANVLRIFANPAARDSEPAIIATEPSGAGIEIKERARTVRGPNTSTAVGALRQGDDNIFTVTGTVNAPLREPAETTLHEPALVFARLLAEHLAAAGISASPSDPLTARRVGSGKPPACRLAGADEDFSHPDAVIAIVRTPLSVVLARCNQDSENLYAESLLKLIGHTATTQPGTWANGTSVVRMQVRDRLGPEAAAAIFLSDGSGLSRANKVTPRVLAQWLNTMAADRSVGPVFIDSLPRAKSEGTMRRRFLDKRTENEIRGKSGAINGVRTLSGYVTDPETNHRVAYSILVNDIPASVSSLHVKDFHEDVVVLADHWLSRQDRDDAGVRLGGGEARRK